MALSIQPLQWALPCPRQLGSPKNKYPPARCRCRHCRYGLVRVRENAESIAFYGGEDNEARLLMTRLRAAVDNFGELLKASRNLSFFTSFYR